MMQRLSFRPALLSESSRIASLANAAYRGETSRQGWTTEADLLDGLRTTVEEVRSLIGSEHSIILIGIKGDEIIASVCLDKDTDAAHIGMFVVNPVMQGSGIGKQLLAYAESYAQQHWGISKFLMHVISVRHELIGFYVRRGYRRTGKVRPFPVNPVMWQSKMDGLQLEQLEKSVSA